MRLTYPVIELPLQPGFYPPSVVCQMESLGYCLLILHQKLLSSMHLDSCPMNYGASIGYQLQYGRGPIGTHGSKQPVFQIEVVVGVFPAHKKAIQFRHLGFVYNHYERIIIFSPALSWQQLPRVHGPKPATALPV